MQQFKRRKYITQFILSNRLSPKYLINTHCHIDHVLGNNFIKNRFDIEFLIPEEDEFLFEVHYTNSFGLRTEQLKFPKPDRYLNENLNLMLGNDELKLLYTPGHSPGEYCIYLSEASACITGDVLFREGIGRTDLWGGNYSLLMNSITTKLLTLPDSTIIYPGHGPESTIGYEKMNNPFLK